MKRYRRIQDGKEFIEVERNSFRIKLVHADDPQKEHPVTKRHLEQDFEPLIEVGGGE